MGFGSFRCIGPQYNKLENAMAAGVLRWFTGMIGSRTFILVFGKCISRGFPGILAGENLGTYVNWNPKKTCGEILDP